MWNLKKIKYCFTKKNKRDKDRVASMLWAQSNRSAAA
jgi:hypothetical protein